MKTRLYKAIIAVAVISCFFVPPYLFAQDTKSITVSAAISLKPAFEEIVKVYGGKVLFNFGGSGALARQIEAGAPVDVFASASQKDMDALEGKGLIVLNSRQNFVGNEVVLIVPLKSGTINKFADLQNMNAKKIAVGNPKTVPAGRYAMEVLTYLKISEKTKDKLIFGEHVRQVLDYTARNEVDAAIVYSTDAMAARDAVRIVETAPKNSHTAIVYPIALMKDSKKIKQAQEFVNLLLSEKGRAILKKHGFKTVD